MNELALLLLLHLASMLTPGLNTSAVIANTLAGGRLIGYQTAGCLALGALTLSTFCTVALAGLMLNYHIKVAMLGLSLIVIAYFSLRVVRKLVTTSRFGVTETTYPAQELLLIYILNPQSIVFFSVLIFSTGIKFTPLNSATVILLLTANTFLYYALVARFSDMMLRRFQGPWLEFTLNGVLLFFLMIVFYNNTINLIAYGS